MDEFEFPKLDRTKISIFSSFEEAEKADEEYWFSRTPEERLEQVELLRRINYGDAATARLQRVFEIVERE